MKIIKTKIMEIICFLKLEKLNDSCPKAMLQISIKPKRDNNKTAEKIIQSKCKKCDLILLSILKY